MGFTRSLFTSILANVIAGYVGGVLSVCAAWLMMDGLDPLFYYDSSIRDRYIVFLWMGVVAGIFVTLPYWFKMNQLWIAMSTWFTVLGAWMLYAMAREGAMALRYEYFLFWTTITATVIVVVAPLARAVYRVALPRN